MTVIAQNQNRFDASAAYAGAKVLINKSDCNACHALNAKSLGPSFKQVALKYKDERGAQSRLVKKIINGGSGVWGDAMMPAHSSMTDAEVNTIVKYVLSLSEQKAAVKNLPVTGSYTTSEQADKSNKGTYIFRAAYKDKGTKYAAAQQGECVVVLRNPTILVSDIDGFNEIEFYRNKSVAGVKNKGAYLLLNEFDLTDIKSLEIVGSSRKGAGALQVRLDALDGTMIGQAVADTADTKPVVAFLTPTSGKHDVYVVFDEPGAQITSIRVKNR